LATAFDLFLYAAQAAFAVIIGAAVVGLWRVLSWFVGSLARPELFPFR
jgi:hypothetical protein